MPPQRPPMLSLPRGLFLCCSIFTAASVGTSASAMLEDSLPPLDVDAAEAEASSSDRRADFVFPDAALASLPVAEVGKTAFPGEKEFVEAVNALPPGLKDKLKDTIGADFTALRPIPAGKLRRPL